MNGRHASMITSLSRRELKQLPHIRSVRGRYASGGLQCPDRLTLWDRGAVLSLQTTTSALEKRDRQCNDPRRFMAVVSAPYFEHPFKIAKWGLYCLGCSESRENETYFRKQYTLQGFIDHVIFYGPVVIGKAEDRPKHEPPDKPT
ncbi:hypothetical protein F5Y12DRAFT_16169 [Xylaria sp. FL1777]|nr:hypothetical protein F5Y12DRAFT_16169 [Xylaria sp. FL1777]